MSFSVAVSGRFRSLLMAAALSCALPVLPVSAADKPLDKAAVEQIVRDYLLTHPELLLEAMEALGQKTAGRK